MNPTAIIFDAETTGLIDPIQAVEVAYLRITYPNLAINSTFLQRYKPSKPIELGALAVSHILMEELENCPPSSSFKLPEDVTHIIGHNIDYDWKVIGKPEVKRICTKALSMFLWDSLESYSQSCLIYFIYKEDQRKARKLLKEAHSAKQDVENNFLLLQHITETLAERANYKVSDLSLDYLWTTSELARIPKRIPFGKYKGSELEKIPLDYVKWLKFKADFEIDPYLRQGFENLGMW